MSDSDVIQNNVNLSNLYVASTTEGKACLRVLREIHRKEISYDLSVNGKKLELIGIRDSSYKDAENFFKFAEHHLRELAKRFSRKSSWSNIRARLKGLGKRIVNIANLQQILEELNTQLKEGDILEIRTDECWIPWEIIYDVSTQSFLAERFIVARGRLSSNESVSQLTGASKTYSNRLEKILNIIGNGTGCSSEAFEIFNDEKYQDKVISRNPIHRQYHSVANVLELIDKEADLIHFTCHGMLDDIGGRYLQLGPNNVDHHLYSMMLDTVDLGGKIIFLNACSSIAPENSIFSDIENLSSFGWLINKKGGGAIIGTLAPVSGKVSTRVANLFYKYFLQEGNTIGEALFITRKELGEHNEPHALMYSFFGDPNLKKFIS